MPHASYYLILLYYFYMPGLLANDPRRAEGFLTKAGNAALLQTTELMRRFCCLFHITCCRTLFSFTLNHF